MTDEVVVQDELVALKQQADVMGIEYPKTVTKTALKKLIAEKLSAEDASDVNATIKELEIENKRLVRVIITPNDNLKRDMAGEFFSTGNSVLGTISRFVPFNQEWHIENMLLKCIRDKEHQIFVTKKVGDKEFVEPKQQPAYTIQELAPLTKEELAELKQRQIAQEGV